MAKGTQWSREETIVAFYVYCIIPFASSSQYNPTVIYYAGLLGRTSAALNMKIGNLGRLDPELKKKNISGLAHGAKMEEQVWDEFYRDRERLVDEAERIIAALAALRGENDRTRLDEMDYSSPDQVRPTKTRPNQNFFRAAVLSAYDHTCAVTRIRIDELLVASHIKPWAVDQANRLNPRNGICLNSIHDQAFDRGLITIDRNYRIVVSRKVKEHYANGFIDDVFMRYEGQAILLPEKFAPSLAFLQYHHDVIFQGGR